MSVHPSLGIDTNYNVSLKQFLLNYLPSKTYGYRDRNFNGKKFDDTKEVLNKKYDYIRFNTKKFTSLLLFDIDSFPDYDFIRPTIEQIEDYIYQQLAIKPTWITKTNKGFHVAFALSKPIFTYYKNQNINNHHKYLALIEIKKEITRLLNADKAGSHRTTGIWRNPLTHQTKYNLNHIYSLEQLMLILDLSYSKIIPKKISRPNNNLFQNIKNHNLRISKNSTIQKYIDAGFKIGNRNNYSFAMAYKLLYENRTMSYEEIFEIINKISLNSNTPLKQNEIENNIKSVFKYKETMFNPYKKKRGKLSNLMWKLNIHGIKKRRSFAAKYSSKKVIDKNSKKIIDALMITKNIKEISKITNLHIKTVKKYLDNKTFMAKAFFCNFVLTNTIIDLRPLFQFINIFEFDDELNFSNVIILKYSNIVYPTGPP